MKRTASQTFHTTDMRGESASTSLGAVQESVEYRAYPPVHRNELAEYVNGNGYGYAHTSSRSLSRASHMIDTGFKQIRRKLSSSSSVSSSSASRRPSIPINLYDGSSSATTTSSLSSSAQTSITSDLQRAPLPHQDSLLPLPCQKDVAPQTAALASKPHSVFRRFSNLRRRPAASGPSGDYAKYNPFPPPIPSNYPVHAPGGSAARQSAAAANEVRREQEHTRRFLEDGATRPGMVEEVIKDSESGVGMTCSSPVHGVDGVTEKKMGTSSLSLTPSAADLAFVLVN
jgi:F-box and WD-40 domain protein 1/11